jgi:hypothetical protein
LEARLFKASEFWRAARLASAAADWPWRGSALSFSEVSSMGFCNVGTSARGGNVGTDVECGIIAVSSEIVDVVPLSFRLGESISESKENLEVDGGVLRGGGVGR